MSMFGLGSWLVGPVGVRVELHEHEVPDLDEALVAADGRAAVGAVGSAPLSTEDLRARAARAGVGHLRQKLSSSRRWMRSAGTPTVVAPDRLGLVVGGVDGDPEPVGVEAEHLGDDLPGQRDGLAP